MTTQLEEKLFNKNLEQYEKINLMENLFQQNLEHTEEELDYLINQSIRHKDLQVLGYCLAKDERSENIEVLKKLFFECCEKGFVKGLQLLSYQLNITEQSYRDELLSEGFIRALPHEDACDIFKFLVNKGGDLYKDNNKLYDLAYEKYDEKLLSYFISDLNFNIFEKKDRLTQDTFSERVEFVMKLHREKQIAMTNYVCDLGMPLPKVTRKKI